MTEPDRALRVIGYGRQSVMRKDETAASSLSLQSQEALYWSQCHEKGWIGLGFIRDHDEKGDDPTRPGMADLITKAKALGTDAVWVLTLSRFHRDPIEQELAWRALKREGVARLISHLEPFTDDETVRVIFGAFNAKITREIGMHIKSSIAQRARMGITAGITPFGYRRPDPKGKLEPVPDLAPWVEQMFRWYAVDLLSLGEICVRLEAAGVPSPNASRGTSYGGGLWRYQSLYSILSCPTYLGIAHAGTTRTPNAHPAIVSQELFTLAQSRFGTRVRRDRLHDGSWLDKLVFCECGLRASLVSQRNRAGEIIGARFVCRSVRSTRVPTCAVRPKSHMAGSLEAHVAQELVDGVGRALAGPSPWRAAFERAERAAAVKTPDAGQRRRALEKRLDECARQQDRLLTLVARGTLAIERWETEDERISAEKREAEAALNELATPLVPEPFKILEDSLGVAYDNIALLAVHQPHELRPVLHRWGVTAGFSPPYLRFPDPLAFFFADT